MPRKQTPETNVQFVKRLMEQNALNQFFIIDAIYKQARMIVETPFPELEKAFGKDNIITADFWRVTAEILKNEIDARESK